MRISRLLFPFLLLLSGCSLFDPKLSSPLSREDALRLYNGEIVESVWIEQLDTVSRNLPIANTQSVQLADGFLFYETEVREGVSYVVDVIPPADAPESLKVFAASLCKKQPSLPKELHVRKRGGKLYLNGEAMSEEAVCAELRKFGQLPEGERPENLGFSGDLNAAAIQKFLSAFTTEAPAEKSE